jgi:hypothetical protein
LETVDHRETAIDRVGALARASRLGRALWHWRYAGQPNHAEVLTALVRRGSKRLQISNRHPEYEILVRACKQSLLEWYFPKCRSCRGAAEQIINKKRVLCPNCGGTGLHRYGDYERMDGLGLSRQQYRRWEPRLRDLHLILSGADVSAVIRCRTELERG